jgi:hypothetical protein
MAQTVSPKVPVDTEVVRIKQLTSLQWRRLKQLQGPLNVLYLRLRYGSADTRVLLAYSEGALVHAEWIVPARKISGRYPFVSTGSYAIISCLTLPACRGLGIYPSQIQRVVDSEISTRTYYIWTTSSNEPSLKGIFKAGGTKFTDIVQTKWFWGCISKVEILSSECAAIHRTQLD